jgi:hypothetical protein
MGKTLLLAVFPELYAIITVAVTFLVTGLMGDPVVAAEVVEAAAEVAAEAAAVL